MSALRILRGEHEAILRVLELTETMARRVEHGQAVPPDAIATVLQFFSFFAHRVHRDKEEELLFPALRDKGLHEGPGCIGALLAQHEEGQGAFQEMVNYAGAYEQGDPAAARAWAQAARRYVELLRQHMRREDDVLFMHAERLLTDSDQQALASEFEKIDERAKRAGVSDLAEACEELARRMD